MDEKYETSRQYYPPPYEQGQPSAPGYGQGPGGYRPPQGGYGPPQGGYAPTAAPQPVFVPVAAPAPAAAPAVNTVQVNLQNNMGGGGGRNLPGSCPVCGGMDWTGTYGCCAWFCCIVFFPIGVLFCLCMRKKKCSKCGFTLN